MNWFMVRVELHDAQWPADYNILHQGMDEIGGKKTITSNEGVEHHLAWGEYFFQTQLSGDTIFAAAKTVASKTGRKFSVTVTETGYVRWAGLHRVAEEAKVA